VQHVRKWCREFENGQKDIRDDDRTDRYSTSSACVNAAEVEEVIVGNKQGAWKVTTWDVEVVVPEWLQMQVSYIYCDGIFFNWSHVQTNSSTR